MARSTYVYVLLGNEGPGGESKVLGTFTVKHELLRSMSGKDLTGCVVEVYRDGQLGHEVRREAAEDFS